MTPLVIEVRGRVRPGRRDALLGLFETHLAPRAERNAAQRLVVWMADIADDDAFTIFEIYSDAEAAAANAQADWFVDYLNAAGPLLAAAPAVSNGTPRWVKGVDL